MFLYFSTNQNNIVLKLTLNLQFVDFQTLCKFKDHCLRREEINGSYSQQFLVLSLLNKNYAAHDAVHDVTALQDLYKEILDTGLVHVLYFILQLQKKPFVTMKVLSQSLMRKLAEASLGFSHLRIIHKRDSVNGIHNFLKEFKFCTRSVVIRKLVQ